MTDERTRRHFNKLCIDCAATTPGAGRLRCNTCHAINVPDLTPTTWENGYPCQVCEKEMTRPGAVLCGLCQQLLKVKPRNDDGQR